MATLKLDRGVHVIRGRCPQCNNKDNSLIIMDYWIDENRKENSKFLVRCFVCTSRYEMLLSNALKNDEEDDS